VHEPACIEHIRAQFDAARPLVKWLGEHVGAAS
jgi:hypothetical protein